MSIRRLSESQPESFAFTAENAHWAKAEIKKYPDGRQASAVLALLWRAQEQEGWITRPAVEEVARLLDMPTIRVLEVATFYTMFHLEPVGSTAHVMVCGTTPCMLRGAEELVAICKRRIAEHPHERSADGRFSWEEMECLGACVNAPMVQIGADTYEDLTSQSFEKLLDALENGKAVKPGPQVKRQFAAPQAGLTTLTGRGGKAAAAADNRKGADVEMSAVDGGVSSVSPATPAAAKENKGRPDPSDAPEAAAARATPDGGRRPDAAEIAAESAPERLARAPADGGDDLRRISGVGPKLESLLNQLGIYTFAQIAAWTPENVTWVDNRLTFKGRIARDDWVGQAKRMTAGRESG